MKQDAPVYRNDRNAILAGVCAGLGEHFGVDPWVFRVLAIGMFILSMAFPAVMVYLIFILTLPRKTDLIAKGEIVDDGE